MGDPDSALNYFKRIIHVKNDNRRVLSNLSAQLAYAMAEHGATTQLEGLLSSAPRQADRALICLGAAQGFLAAATPPVDASPPHDAYEMLERCNLDLALPQTRGVSDK